MDAEIAQMESGEPMAVMATGAPPKGWEKDLDSLHVMPLGILPLETPGLRRARLIKNVRLDSVVELFHDVGTGSGQIEVSALCSVFDWPDDTTHPDETLVALVCRLHSYDVYTLRIQLRSMGIDVENQASLKLSKAKSAELTVYMKNFTMPLIKQIFGNTGSDIEDVGQLIAMLASPDKGEALKNLKMMADKLKIGLKDVPKFLEDYGDVFMSLAYYKGCLDTLIPQVMDYTESTQELKNNLQLRSDRRLMRSVDSINEQLSDITTSITGRFESFERNSQSMWEDITAESFAKVKKMIEGHHVTVGGVLCGLSVKMNSWTEQFGKGGGGMVRRGDFVLSDMIQGMDKIAEIEKSAPSMSDM